MRANPLQLLNAIRGETTHIGLVYVELLIDGQNIIALVNNGATHNFKSTGETARLCLNLAKVDSKLKAMNNQAQERHGRVKNEGIHMGDWKGRINFFIIPLDDFDFILVTISSKGPRLPCCHT